MDQIELKLDHKTITITLPDGVVADPKLLDGGHPLGYVVKQKNATANYLSRVAELLKDIRVDNVLEFCGGIGLIPLTLNDVIHWKKWTTVELDPACKTAYVCPNVDFKLQNMYDPIDLTADLIFMDFPSNTIPKMWREPQRAALLKRIADSRPKYWEITDVGWYWIHLANHWPIYQARFGKQVTRENYHELFDEYMRETYGYQLVKHTLGGGAGYYLFSPVEVKLA